MSAYYHEAKAGRRPCPPYVNTSRAEHITRCKLTASAESAALEWAAALWICTHTAWKFVCTSAGWNCSFSLDVDQLSRSTHATLSRDREVRASSWLHCSPDPTLSVYTCKSYTAYCCLCAGRKKPAAVFFSFSPGIIDSVCVWMWIQAHTRSLITAGVKSLSPWQHVSRSYHLLTAPKKSQLDENKHMLFVKLKMPAKYHKVSQMSRPFNVGSTKHLLFSWPFLPRVFRHRTFYTAAYKTLGCADQYFCFTWRVSVIERNLQRIILRLSFSLQLCGAFLTHCFSLMTYNVTVVVYSHHFYTTLLQHSAASQKNPLHTSCPSQLLAGLVLCLQGGFEKPFQQQSDHVADTLVFTG